MSFHVGQKVVCIDQDNPTEPGPHAVKGCVYTISEIIWYGADITPFPGLCFQFYELRFEGHAYYLAGFEAEGFRPVKTTNIEIFRQMLVTPPQKVDA